MLSTNNPGQVLALDENGRPIWQDIDVETLGLASGRVATEGVLRQTIPETLLTVGAKVLVHYEDPTGGSNIAVQIAGQQTGVDFTVVFTALPPAGTFLVYTVLP